MRSIYAQSRSEDPSATLDDLREAVTTLEDAERTARRVLGGAHPIAEGMRTSCDKREPRSAPAKATSSPSVRPSRRWRRGMRKTIRVPTRAAVGTLRTDRETQRLRRTGGGGEKSACGCACRALGDGAAPALGDGLVDGLVDLVGLVAVLDG